MKTNKQLLVAIAWVMGVAAMGLGVRALLSGSDVHAAANLDNSEWMANVSNGQIAASLNATGDSPIIWNPPRPGEPCLVQVDVSGGASLTWCLQVKAVDSSSVPYATLATGTGDQNFVTTAWPVMNLTVSSYSSGTVSAWGAQGTR